MAKFIKKELRNITSCLWELPRNSMTSVRKDLWECSYRIIVNAFHNIGVTPRYSRRECRHGNMTLLSSHEIVDISAADARLQSCINNWSYLWKCTFFFGFAPRFDRRAASTNACEMITAFRYNRNAFYYRRWVRSWLFIIMTHRLMTHN